MTKWTGDNLSELSDIWSAELANHNTEFSVNLDGSLTTTSPGFFTFSVPCPEGCWFRPGLVGGTPEADLFATSAEVDPIDLP
jgi:hypothetical protein